MNPIRWGILFVPFDITKVHKLLVYTISCQPSNMKYGYFVDEKVKCVDEMANCGDEIIYHIE